MIRQEGSQDPKKFQEMLSSAASTVLSSSAFSKANSETKPRERDYVELFFNSALEKGAFVGREGINAYRTVAEAKGRDKTEVKRRIHRTLRETKEWLRHYIACDRSDSRQPSERDQAELKAVFILFKLMAGTSPQEIEAQMASYAAMADEDNLD